MVIMGAQNSPAVLLMRTVPTMGPVQEKDTSTRVRARKKMPPRLPLPALESLPFTHLEGRVISKSPKKLAANTMNTAKNTRFGSQWVESQLKMSAVTASPPIARVSIIIMEMGTVYSSTMNRP